MSEITTIGLDLAKNVFQVHAIDETDGLVMRKRFGAARCLAFFAGLPRMSGRHGGLCDGALLGARVAGARP